jgi:hypothetical protein
MNTTEELTWRDKVAIIDTTARIAVTMFIAIAVFCELLVAAGH